MIIVSKSLITHPLLLRTMKHKTSQAITKPIVLFIQMARMLKIAHRTSGIATLSHRYGTHIHVIKYDLHVGNIYR